MLWRTIFEKFEAATYRTTWGRLYRRNSRRLYVIAYLTPLMAFLQLFFQANFVKAAISTLFIDPQIASHWTKVCIWMTAISGFAILATLSIGEPVDADDKLANTFVHFCALAGTWLGTAGIFGIVMHLK